MTEKENGAKSIGTCKMDAQGTLILDLIAEGDDGLIGHGQLVYAKDHPQYQMILQHVGPMFPGEIKAVMPWPD
ncbi:MAG: hypothetical protein LCH63_15950 [Candidatus Melainabacteria bacterium]|jgi:hypothetical protein|nr:hypothetical protein [Candidatus Melainabacteria bacterium]